MTADSAIRLVDFETYQALMDASFATEGLSSANISGGYRPESNMTRPHPEGRGLDINRITVSGEDIGIRDDAVNQGAPALSSQPDKVREFSRNLLNTGNVTQVIQPWETYGLRGEEPGWQTNWGNTPAQQKHSDHLHFGIARGK